MGAATADSGLRRVARRVRRLGQVEPPLLGRALRGLPGVLLLTVLDRAALDEAARGLRWLGARDRRGDADRDPAGATAPGRGRCEEAPRRDRLPGARPRSRNWPAASSSSSRGRAISPTLATRSRSTCSCASSSHRLRRRGAGSGASHAGSAPCTSPPRSGSATRSATPRSPTSCASSTPTSRSTGSRSTR